MMKTYIPNRSKPKSLTAQIRDAEREVLNRQRRVGVRSATLVRKIHQQMTAPATLLLAGGIGFILGEFTRRQTPKSRDAADKSRAAETTTPLRTAMNLMTTVHTLYTALPLAWKIKSFTQPGVSQTGAPGPGGQSTERQYQPLASDVRQSSR